MELDPARCWEAVLSRDRRFDGRFFSGVVTTGVYCRPICPVHPPKRENVRWFSCAAAAEAAGFRPCRRCRPETSPGTPAWMGSSAVVSRALRLIADGVLDGAGVDQLAARLGVGARQLRRLFAEHLGASPLAVARARRVHFAVKLLGETALPISEVAFSAGFNSIRQFNHAVRETFQRSPSALRRAHTRSARLPLVVEVPDKSGLVVRLPYRPPLDWTAITDFLRPRAIPGVESVDGGWYRRTIELNGAPGIVAAQPAKGDAALLMHIALPRYDGLIQAVERARRLFDLGADPLQIGERLRRSPALRRLVDAAPGLRVPGAWDSFELAVRAILGQQVSVQAATTFAARLVKAYGTPIAGNGTGLTHLFPRAETLIEADLDGIGLTQARARTIRALAAGLCDGRLTLDGSLGLDDAVAHLCAIPGIGTWTAQYIAMRALGEPDAFPSDDLGLRRAFANGKALASASELSRCAEAWRPWRAYAAMYLWSGTAGAG